MKHENEYYNLTFG